MQDVEREHVFSLECLVLQNAQHQPNHYLDLEYLAMGQVTSPTFQSDDILYVCPTTILEWRRLSEDQVSYFKEYTSMSGS